MLSDEAIIALVSLVLTLVQLIVSTLDSVRRFYLRNISNRRQLERRISGTVDVFRYGVHAPMPPELAMNLYLKFSEIEGASTESP
ncbi:hypothetical protein TWF106_007200 [Orbilia oligospora]|uniref:Uncharacterized protein n=1 Tax=Orbilia oligospora TaxID=2813651 RepID=A0A7C8UV30_ORBOL|nr:hypothetical protein TWF106_007200 [Orbilia oligospora]